MPETTDSAHSFEEALAELEELVSRMESGEMPLAESLAAYKRGEIDTLVVVPSMSGSSRLASLFGKRT